VYAGPVAGSGSGSTHEAAGESGAANPYTVYAFYRSGTVEGDELLARMRIISDLFGDRLEVKPVDVFGKESAGLLKKYEVFSIPSVIVVSPDGVVTGGVRGIPEVDDIARALVPGRMPRVIAALQKNKVVLLLILGKGRDDEEPSLKSVEAFHRIFRKSVEVVELDPSVEEDAETLRYLGIDSGGVKSFEVVMLSTSGVVAVLTPPLDMKQLIGSFQRVLLSKSGCGGTDEGGLKSSCDE